MNPRLTGKMVCWKKDVCRTESQRSVRANQGIHLGDIGLVVSQSVTELQVLLKDQVVFFHTSEVEAL